MVLVEESPPRGDLYELEQTTYHWVVDRRSHEIVMTFEGRLEAKLSTHTGLWDDPHLSGVREVAVTADQRSVTVKYHDGREEVVPLPQ